MPWFGAVADLEIALYRFLRLFASAPENVIIDLGAADYEHKFPLILGVWED